MSVLPNSSPFKVDGNPQKACTLHDWSKAPTWARSAIMDENGASRWLRFKYTYIPNVEYYEERPAPEETCEEQEAWDQLEAARRALFERRMEEAHGKQSDHPQKSHAAQLGGGEIDPTGRSAKDPGAKLDSGKACIRRGVLEYFPRALIEVSKVSEFGAQKYTWGGWGPVPDGVIRYGDAEVRHVVKAAIEGPIDADSGLLHAAHEAWNALARLELMLRAEGGNKGGAC